MPLYRLSGLNTGVPTIAGYSIVDKLEHAVAATTLFTARGAFLALVKLNVFYLADKLHFMAESETNEDKIKLFWYKAGGNYDILKNVFQSSWIHELGFNQGGNGSGGGGSTGKTKDVVLKGISGLDRNNSTISPDYTSARIGYTGAEIAALVVAATPLIVAVIKIFKNSNVNVSDIPLAGTPIINPGGGYTNTGNPSGGVYVPSGGSTILPGSKILGLTPLQLGGAAVVLYLIFK